MIAEAYAAAAEHGSSSGLPQFNSSTFTSQGFWAIVSFVVLLLLLKKYVIPGITDVLDARARQIQEDLESAATRNKEAEKLLNEHRIKLNTAMESAARTVEEAARDASRVREQALADLEQEMAKKKILAMEEIEQAKRKAVVELKSVAAEAAILATEKLIGKHMTQEDADQMVNEALNQMGPDARGLN
ncbi:MAG: F0F1 ATP synthase subunit B [Magnetococcales bacterium]|nr:F0F1 ATP synthase subunit B [Magnetococcales bacterium]